MSILDNAGSSLFRVLGLPVFDGTAISIGFHINDYWDNAIFGLIANNKDDIRLHVVLAVVMLFLGFGTVKQTAYFLG